MLRRLIPTDILFQKTPLIPEVCAVPDILKSLLNLFFAASCAWHPIAVINAMKIKKIDFFIMLRFFRLIMQQTALR